MTNPIARAARNILTQYMNENGILVTVYRARKAPKPRVTARSGRAVQTRDPRYGV